MLYRSGLRWTNGPNRTVHMILRLSLISVLATSFSIQLWASSKSPSSVGIEKSTRNIDTARIASPSESNWLSYGLDYDEQRYSRLAQIDSDNITDLGLDWHFDTDYNRGLEATPLVVDGVMYVTGNWSVVYALDASPPRQDSCRVFWFSTTVGGGRMRARSESLFDRTQGVGVAADDAAG